jgi:hypothetical protein
MNKLQYFDKNNEVKDLKLYRLEIIADTINHIISQHHVALVNDFICKSSIEGVASCCASTLLASYLVMTS